MSALVPRPASLVGFVVHVGVLAVVVVVAMVPLMLLDSTLTGRPV